MATGQRYELGDEMPEAKTAIIEQIFNQRWNPDTAILTQSLVTLSDVSAAIEQYNRAHPNQQTLSTRNPANFFKDFIRRKDRANERWPTSVLARGYSARQETGNNACFRFVPISQGQMEPFPSSLILAPTESTPVHRIESASLPLASRRLGRSDEPWLVQVIVRLRVIETHLALFSHHNIVQVDHLQMSVKLRRSEIDALFLAIERIDSKTTREVVSCCEAKSRRDDILEDQVLGQVQAVFGLSGVTQDVVIPLAVKARGPSRIHVVEFDLVTRKEAATLSSLTVASDAIYEFVPPVPGIGE